MNFASIQRYVHINPPKGPYQVDNKTLFGERMDVVVEDTLAKSFDGSLASKISGSQGTLTLAADHTFVNGDRVDVYWDSGSRRGMTVGTVSGTSVPVSGGFGDSLPNVGTLVSAHEPYNAALKFGGKPIQSLVYFGDARGNLMLADSLGGPVTEFKLPDGGGMIEKYKRDGDVMPSGTGVTQLFLSQKNGTLGNVAVIIIYGISSLQGGGTPCRSEDGGVTDCNAIPEDV